MLEPVALAPRSELDMLFHQLAIPQGQEFFACTRMVALLEAWSPRLNKVDRMHLGRLMVSGGHQITLSCK
jgi:hypothetical protein